MKASFQDLNKIFESRIRLGIMSLLMVEDHIDFNALKETLQVTDGNLASHLKSLEKEDYLTLEKSFLGRKPNTVYRITKLGSIEFNKHIKALEALIKNHK